MTQPPNPDATPRSMTFSEALRLADRLGIPKSYWDLEEDSSRWSGPQPPMGPVAAANYVAGRVVLAEFRPGYYTLRDGAGTLGTAWGLPALSWDECDICQRPHVDDCGPDTYHLEGMVYHLHAEHGWSRTRLADWLDLLTAA